MDRILYRAEDFASDESFVSYYLRTDDQAVQFWEEWISHHPEKVDEILNAEELLALLYFRLPENEMDEEIERFEPVLTKGQPAQPLRVIKTNWPKTTWLSLVAAMLVIVGVVISDFPKKKPVTYVTHFNDYGKILTLRLGDGTKVTLNANSSLRLPQVFETDKREVFLKGEAFFEVAKDKLRPFTVNANGTKTTVLGTKFNVSAYEDLPEVKVALQEGSVELSANSNRDKMILKPAEMGVFSSASKALVRRRFDQSTVEAWRSGILIFNRASFNDIAKQLGHLYGIKLLDQSGKTNWNYSAQFEKMDYINVIRSICFAENLTFKQTNQTIILKPKQ